MGIGAALAISTAEIGNLGRQFGVISHNIANASTPGYAAETLEQASVLAGGLGMGAANSVVRRAVDAQAQADLQRQNGEVAALAAQQAALGQIDAVAGAVGGGRDIGGLLAGLSNAFTALLGDPANQAGQLQVVDAARQLAGQINAVGDAIAAQRQAAHDAIVAGVGRLNDALDQIGALDRRIAVARGQGASTAELENQRQTAEDTVSALVSARFIAQPDGGVLVATSGGLTLPTQGGARLVAADAPTPPGSFAPGGGIPGITLNGEDIGAQLDGGAIGGNLRLRDATLPTMQANLDEFARTLSTRFDAQGLALFTDAQGLVPSAVPPPSGPSVAQSGYVGYASAIVVNPAVVAQPSAVRDGTHLVAAGGGGATAFTPNPAGGPSGFADLIGRVLQFALGAEVAPGVAQPAPNVAGLGPSGTLNAGFAAPPDLAGLAAAVTGQQAQASADVAGRRAGAVAVQSMLQSNLSASTAVSIDAEMSRMIVLQNAYGANARVLSAVQSMWAQLLQVLR